MSRLSTPPEVEIPAWLALAVGASVAAGLALGALTTDGAASRLVRATFFAAAFGYLTVSMIDFVEHFRLEKVATGRYLASTVVPLGETLNHVATTAVVMTLLLLGRPVASPLAARDAVMLLCPGLFLLLGWRDELVYHRRRAQHREDVMHTVAHLAAGVMLTSFVLMRVAQV